MTGDLQRIKIYPAKGFQILPGKTFGKFGMLTKHQCV